MEILPAQPKTPRNWYEIWLDVWRHPGVEVFQSLLNEPNHTSSRGLLWIVATSIIVAIMTGFSAAQAFSNFDPRLGSNYISYICIIVLTPIFSVFGMIVGTALYHWIARLFGGRGTWNDLLFCLAVVSAPSGLIGGIISLIDYLLTAIRATPFLIVMSIISIGFGIFALVLYIYAIRAVENVGTGQAVLIVFIPVIIGLALALCVALALIPIASSIR